MSATSKSVAVIVLTYLLFGLANLLQFGVFVVPITYVELLVFVLVLIPMVINRKEITKTHITFLLYAAIGIITHPFLWEIFLDQESQFQIQNAVFIDVLRIIQVPLLAYFFYLVSFDRAAHKLRIEWLVPAALSLVLFFNPPPMFTNFLFILSGFSAIYAVKRRNLDDFHFETLIGIGIVYFINFFYLLD